MLIQFTVPAIPIAQPRHRIGVVGGKGRAFGAKKSHPIHDFKASVRLAASEVYDGPPLSGAIDIGMVFVMPRPKQKIWKTKPMPRESHTKKPDADNLAKGVFDALNGFLFVDDSQLWNVSICKVIAAGDEQPHTLITLTEESNGANTR